MKGNRLSIPALHARARAPKWESMAGPGKKWIDRTPMREIVMISGFLLILMSPVVGAIPGPGGVVVFAAGLAMVLRTSRWARKQYVRFKRWQPEAGRWTDWGLRRRSAKRREALLKAEKERERTQKSVQGD